MHCCLVADGCREQNSIHREQCHWEQQQVVVGVVGGRVHWYGSWLYYTRGARGSLEVHPALDGEEVFVRRGLLWMGRLKDS